MMKILSLATLLVISLVLSTTILDIANAYTYPVSSPPPRKASPPPRQYTTPPPPPPSKHLVLKPGVPAFCPAKCLHRCSRNPRDLCKRLCMACCTKCKCVPIGPYGDKNSCPCYRDILNKKGKPKCP